MTRPHGPQSPAPMDWVLVGNAARARCFVRDPDNGALRELDDFVHPASRQKGQDLARDRGGHVMKSEGSTQLMPHTDPHDREHERFARELAAHLDAAALAHRMPGLVLIVSNPFLGVLRARLGPASSALLRGSVALDLCSFVGPELERRVSDALAASAPA